MLIKYLFFHNGNGLKQYEIWTCNGQIITILLKVNNKKILFSIKTQIVIVIRFLLFIIKIRTCLG